jgi:hypothetical protein
MSWPCRGRFWRLNNKDEIVRDVDDKVSAVALRVDRMQQIRMMMTHLLAHTDAAASSSSEG